MTDRLTPPKLPGWALRDLAHIILCEPKLWHALTKEAAKLRGKR